MSGSGNIRVGKPQTSRKGRKAWRKNVDIQDVEEGLDEKRDREILIGKGDDEEDFVIDSTPSDSKLAEKWSKKSKTSDILSNKSKIEALTGPPRAQKFGKSKVQGVKKTEILRLVKLNGGKYKDESKALNRAEQDGLIRSSKTEDLWGEVEEPQYVSAISEYTKATAIPKTMKEPPIKTDENDLTKKHIDAGKSYNPSLESWKALINKEYDIEYKLEVNRQQIEEHKEKIKNLMVTLGDEEVLESDDEEDDEAEGENDQEEEDFKLSINKPTQVKIKTKSKRNREEKHKKRMELEKQIKDFKKQIQDLQNLDSILQHEKTTNTAAKKSHQKKNKKLFKYDAVETPLEVKLSDELTNNLKNLKAEGNLFYDQMKNLQSTGKIEARVPVQKKRKYQPKMTEKWSYKNFK